MRQQFTEFLYLARLARSQRGSRQSLIELQAHRLRRVMVAAAREVPYYQELFGRNSIPGDQAYSLETLGRLPVSQKSSLRRTAQENLLSRSWNSSRLNAFSTTGSTGVPFTVVKTPVEELLCLFLRWRVARFFGLRRGSTILRLTSGMRRPRYWELFDRLGSYRDLDVRLTDPPEEIAGAIRRSRPDVVMGNAGVLTRVAQELLEEGPLGKSPDFVVSAAELLNPAMRSILLDAFGCPVFDSYNCVETMHPLAWECSQTGLFHVCDDAVVLEVLRDGRPVSEGEEGEVVITSLVSFAMPVIRWSQGDLAELGPASCPCGSPFSTIRRIKGRMTDYLQLPDGSQIFASTLAYVLHQRGGWILQYQLIQETVSRIVLKASVLRTPTGVEVRILQTELEKELPSGVSVEIELVRHVDPEKNGKFRVLMSRIGSPYEQFGTNEVSGRPPRPGNH